LSPFNAFLFLQGIETLSLRMQRHVENALGVARFLETRPEVSAVRHPAGEPLAARYLPRGAGAVFSFDLAGGREAGVRFIGALSLWSHLANVGDARSLVIQPATTTHRQLSDDELAGAGIAPGTIRLSVGLEDLADLLWDLEVGLTAARAS
jgi:O-acetylhomoserine (thiol)-lyase